MTTTRSGRLSLVFQEILTAIVRIRAGREKVPSLEHFRQQMRGALAGAQEEAVRRGYVRAEAFLLQHFENIRIWQCFNGKILPKTRFNRIKYVPAILRSSRPSI